MEFNFSYQDLSRPEKILQRFFEILPAALSWGIFALMIVFSFIKPVSAAVIIIAFSFYWFLRLLYMNIMLWLRHSRLELEAKTDWLERARGLGRIYDYWKELGESGADKGDISLMIHRKELRALEKSKQKAVTLEEMHQLIIIPVAAGEENLIFRTVASLVGGNFPPLKATLILAFSSEVSEQSKLAARRIIERYRQNLSDFFDVTYPHKPDSGKSFKGAVISHAAREAAEYFKAKKVAHRRVIVSCFRPGVVINPDYLSCLTYRYLVYPDRLTAAFGGISVYDSSIWQAKTAIRVLNAASSFFQLAESVNPDNLVSFSGYSISLEALVEFGFWPQGVVSVDPAVFWKAFIYFNGKFQSKPLYTAYPIDIVEGPEAANNFAQLYEQKKNLACSGESFPILMRAFMAAWRIPPAKKLVCALKLLEAQVLSAIWPFLLFIVGWIPALLAQREFSNASIYYSAPRIPFVIFSLMVLTMAMCMIMTNFVLPKRKAKLNLCKQIAHFLALIFLVPLGVFLTAIASLEVQTSTMFGNRPKP